MSDSHTIPVCAAAREDISAINFVMPDNACDCHSHVFASAEHPSLVANRSYTPPQASLEKYQQLLGQLGFSRAVIVQPSVYGTDNRVTLDAVATAGPQFRAVVVVDQNTSLQELAQMHAAGARAARVNLLFRSSLQIDNLTTLANKIAELGWHLQLLIDVSQFEQLYRTLAELPVSCVFDHMGHMPCQEGINHAGFQAMLRLIGEGKGWAKLSGSYRITTQQQPIYTDVTDFAQALIRTNPDQLVYGSDWPHPHFARPMPEDGELLNMLSIWAPDAKLRQKILADNPARLYGFEQSN